MTFLVTGATGFLGSTIARVLLDNGHSVRAIHRSSSTFDLLDDDVRERIDWRLGDVLDPESLEAAMEKVDGVIHAAAYVGFDGRRGEEKLFQINVTGTANTVDAALATGVQRLVHVSSIAALGRSVDQTECLDETAQWKDSSLNTAYAISKYRAEMEVQRGVAMGLDAVIVNPSVIMGPGRLGENTMQIAEQLLDRKLPFRPKGGTNIVDVEDVALGCLAAYNKGQSGQRYVLSGHNLLWRDILQSLADSLCVKAPKNSLPNGLLVFAGALFELGSYITHTNPLLTRETARLSTSVSCYNNAKARKDLSCAFRPFEETADRVAHACLNLKSQG